MPIKKINTSDVEHQHPFVLIVGKSGAGKTYALGTLPEEKTLILAIEPGLLTLSDKTIDVWKIESIEDLVDAYKEIKNGSEYENVCIDSLTELSEMAFAALKPQFKKSQTFDLYNEFTTRMISIIKSFRDLHQYNIFVTSLLKETDDGYTIDVAQKSLGNRIPAYFDFTFLVKSFQKDGKTTRALVSDNSVLDFLKSRSKNIEEYEPVNLTSIIEKVLKKPEGLL